MSLFHNSPEAEKLATAWHIFALWASLAEFCSAVLCLVVGLLYIFGFHAAALTLLPYAAKMLVAAALCCVVGALGQVVFHVKAIFDHAGNRKQLEQKKRMGVMPGGVYGD